MPVYVRWKKDEPRIVRTLPHLPTGNPCSREPCLLCEQDLGNTLPVVLFALGPEDEQDRGKHAAGRWYSARALVLHAECVGMPPARWRRLQSLAWWMWWHRV